MLTTDYAVYNASQAIGVTVANAGATTYFAADTHSACTIVTLQQSLNGQWVPIMPCESAQSSHILLIAAHSSIPYTLAPGDAPGNPNAWTPGTYRIALSFGDKADGSDATRYVAYSSGFSVLT